MQHEAETHQAAVQQLQVTASEPAHEEQPHSEQTQRQAQPHAQQERAQPPVSSAAPSAPAGPACLSRHVEEWSDVDVGQWLESCGGGLASYAASFLANHIDGSALVALARDDLQALGVTSVGHRLHILRSVEKLAAS